MGTERGWRRSCSAHLAETGSEVARRLLAGPAGYVSSFVKVVPTEYRLALESGAVQVGASHAGTDGAGADGAGVVHVDASPAGAGQEMASARG